MKNRNGFTLVELLVVITLLGLLAGIGIFSFTSITNKSKVEKETSDVSMLKMTAELYIQANKDEAPKEIGETKKIPLSILKEQSYITEDIVNSKGEDCMKNSYINIYKFSTNDYLYSPQILCGNDTIEPVKSDKIPSISISYPNSENVSAPYFNYVLRGNDNDNSIRIDGYRFVIYEANTEDVTDYNNLKDSDFKQVYDSGSVSGYRKTVIESKFDLSSYVVLSEKNSIKLRFVVINELGEVGEFDGFLTFSDTVPPICLSTKNEAKDFNDWVGKHTPKTSRTISVLCGDDSRGSGCIRTDFSKTWPNDDKVGGKKIYYYGAEFAPIVLSDNSNNKKSCTVRVNVDMASPRVVLTAKANNKVLKTVSVGGYDESTLKAYSIDATINANDYDNSINPPKNDGKVWFNHEYKKGVTYEVSITDNFYLDKWEWKVNKPGLPTKTSLSNVISNISSSNTDGAKGSFNPVQGKIDSTPRKITVNLINDGLRYGELWVYDKAGNYSIIRIYANIDKVAPDPPADILTYYTKTNSKSARNDGTYPKKTWTNRYVRAQIDSIYKKDIISGYEKVKYRAFPHKSNNARDTGSGSDANFVFDSTYQGKNSIDFSVCDYAENCSAYSSKAEIWLDTINPECKNVISYNPNNALSKYGWLGYGESATVTGICSDTGSSNESGSGCTKNNKSYKYSTEINTTHAGPNGDNVNYTYYDYAGNSVLCKKDQTVRIDTHFPKCTVTKTVSKPEVNGWLNAVTTKGTATVNAHCTDTVGIVSGCATDDFSKKYDYEIDTNEAGAVDNKNGGSVFDKADNKTDCDAKTVVKIDYHGPRCIPKTIISKGDLSDAGWLGNGEEATVTVDCYDDQGKAFSKCSDDLPSYKYNTNINTTTAGAAGNNIGGSISDIAGNSTSCKANQTVKVDIDIPTCTQSKENQVWKKGSFEITYGCKDTGGSKCRPDFSGGSMSFTSGTVEYATISPFVIKDYADNEYRCPEGKVGIHIDNDPPSSFSMSMLKWNNNSGATPISSSSSNLNGTYTSGWSTKKLFSYPSGSTDTGVGEVYYKSSTDGTNYTKSSYVNLTTNNTDTNYRKLYWIACDKLDNCTNPSTQEFKIDISAPSCTESGDNSSWKVGSHTLYYGCKDNGASGCHTSYSGRNKPLSGAISYSTYTLPGYTIMDNAGNVTNCPAKSRDLYLDNVAPSVPKIKMKVWADNSGTTPDSSTSSNLGGNYSGGWTNRKIFSYPSGSTDSGVGGVYYQWSVNNSTFYTGNYVNLTTQNSNGNAQTIYWRACDSLNNCSSSRSSNYYMDFTAPTISNFSVTSRDTRYNTGTVNLSFSYSDNLFSGVNLSYCISGTNSCSYFLNPSSNSYSSTRNLGNHNGETKDIYVFVKDAAGNISSVNTSYTKYKVCSELSYTQTSTCSVSCDGGTYKRHAYDLYFTTHRCSSSDDWGGEACNTQPCLIKKSGEIVIQSSSDSGSNSITVSNLHHIDTSTVSPSNASCSSSGNTITCSASSMTKTTANSDTTCQIANGTTDSFYYSSAMKLYDDVWYDDKKDEWHYNKERSLTANCYVRSGHGPGKPSTDVWKCGNVSAAPQLGYRYALYNDYYSIMNHCPSHKDYEDKYCKKRGAKCLTFGWEESGSDNPDYKYVCRCYIVGSNDYYSTTAKFDYYVTP